MALDARQEFKLGFLAACADAGLSLDEIRERAKLACAKVLTTDTADVCKYASDPSTIGTLAKLVGGLGAGGLALGAGGGAAAGYLAARLGEQDVDPAAVKNQELQAAFQQAADRARRSMAIRRYRDSAKAPRMSRLLR